MQEELRRLALLGAKDVIVETRDAVAANALYNSLGFSQTVWGHYWRKII